MDREGEAASFSDRYTALEFAIRVMVNSGDPDAVLSAARSFLVFLTNADNPGPAIDQEAKTW